MKSTNLSETNYSALDKEAAILKDHSKRACKCWMWIMIGLVMVIFICKSQLYFLVLTTYNVIQANFKLFTLYIFLFAVMVLFMKIMKKRTT